MRPNLLLSLGQLLVFGSGGVQTLSKTIPVVNLNPDFDHRWWICKEKKWLLKNLSFLLKGIGQAKMRRRIAFSSKHRWAIRQRYSESFFSQKSVLSHEDDHMPEMEGLGIPKPWILPLVLCLWPWQSLSQLEQWNVRRYHFRIQFTLWSWSNKVLMNRSFIHWVWHGPMALVGNRKLNKQNEHTALDWTWWTRHVTNWFSLYHT